MKELQEGQRSVLKYIKKTSISDQRECWNALSQMDIWPAGPDERLVQGR